MTSAEVELERTIIASWFETHGQRSLLSHLPDSVAQKLLSAGSLSSFPAGHAIPIGDDESDLLIVVDGRISVRRLGGSEAQELAELTPGRSLNLPAFFSRASAGAVEHVTTEASSLLRIDGAVVRSCLQAVPGLATYLERVTLHPELHRFKNDLRMVGLSRSEIVTVVSRLDRVPGEAVLPPTKGLVIVVGRGDVACFANEQLGRQQVAHFFVGDYGYLGPEMTGVSLDPAPSTELWVLPTDALAGVLGPERAERLVRVVRALDGALDAAPVDGAGEDIPASPIRDDEDDHLLVKDFYATPRDRRRARRRKVRVVRQHDEMDCGAACLAACARYFGRKISLPVFRSLVHVTREGASMLALKRACNRVGIDAMGVMASFKGLAKLRTPMIALMQYHFVVVYEVRPDSVVYADPARGLMTVGREEFTREWSGNALLLKPTPRLRQYPESQSTFRKYGALLHAHLGSLFEVFVASLLVTIFGLVTPLFTQVIFDHVLARGDGGVLFGLFLGALGLILLSSGVTWVRDYLLSYLTSRLDAKLSTLFLRHTFGLPLSFFAVRNVGDITTRIQEIEKIRNFFTGESIAILVSSFSALVYMAVLGFYSVWFLVLLGVLVPVLASALGLLLPKLLATLRNTYVATARTQSVIFEQFRSLGTVKSLAGEVPARLRWAQSFAGALQLRRKLERLSAVTAGISELFSGLARVSVLLVAVILYLRRELSLGQVVAVNLLIGKCIDPVIRLIMSWTQISEVGVSLARVDDVMTTSPEPKVLTTEHEHHQVKGAIELVNVSFRYGSELSPVVLRNVSLSIEPGQTVALVGPSGSGKSTLAYMINLLYRPTSGRVLIDGIDSRQIPIDRLRSQVTLVIQDSQLLSGSILDNVTLGDPRPSFARAVAACMAADAHDFIMALPNGYGTELGESGSKLSGGQKQRLNVARALYRDPPVLILDEATASLDAVSERVIVDNIRARSKQRTTIIIAHRLNTVRYADRIVYLEGGTIVESGSHDELLARGGRYAQLYRQQLNLG